MANVYRQGSLSYPLLATGRVVCYGEQFGTYTTYAKSGLSYTDFKIRKSQLLTVLGEYVDCKYDPYARVVFIEVCHQQRNLIVTIDLSGDHAKFCQNYNQLYLLCIKERIPLDLVIEDSMIIARYGSSYALVDQISITSEKIVIKGWKDEMLVIPRKSGSQPTRDSTAVTVQSVQLDPEVVQRQIEIEEAIINDSEVSSEPSHVFGQL